MFFRKEAIENQNVKLYGDVLVKPQIKSGYIIFFFVVFFAAIFSWLTFGTYTKKSAVTGWVEPNAGVVKVFSDQSLGVVSRVLVREGDKVESGQPILEITSGKFISENQKVIERLVDLKREEIELLQRKRVEQKKMYANIRESLVDSIERLGKELSYMKNQTKIMEEILALKSHDKVRNSELQEQGYISKKQLNSSQEQLLSTKKSLSDLTISMERKEREKSNLESELSRLETEQVLEIIATSEKVNKINSDLLKLTSQEAYTINANKSGVLHNLNVIEGQELQGVTLIASIVPSESILTAKLIIPIAESGFLAKGQVVEIQYDAFPYQKYGSHKAELVSISDIVYLPGEITNTPISMQSPSYEATAKFTEDFGSRELSITPKIGMTFQAYIKVEERTLLEWLFAPLLSIKGSM